MFGLRVRANAPLRGLTADTSDAAPDVEVHLGEAPPWAGAAPDPDGLIYRAEVGDPDPPVLNVTWLAGRPGIRWSYADGARFYASADAREIWATWPAPLVSDDAQIYLLGPILGYVLRRRGVLSLHASGVVIDGRAAAFCGAPGAGKSTTAAAFSARGFPVLTDDVLALRESDGAVFAYPAYDHLRLWPDSARLIVGDEARLPLLTPTWPKRAFPLDEFGGGLSTRPVPLGWIFLLMPRDDAATSPRVERAGGVDAFLHLVAETSANYLLDREMRSQELSDLSRLMARVPVYRVTPHADPARLPALLDAVLAAVRA